MFTSKNLGLSLIFYSMISIASSSYAAEHATESVETSPPEIKRFKHIDEHVKSPVKALKGYLKRRNRAFDDKSVKYWSNGAALYWFCSVAPATNGHCYKLVKKKNAWIISERGPEKK